MGPSGVIFFKSGTKAKISKKVKKARKGEWKWGVCCQSDGNPSRWFFETSESVYTPILQRKMGDFHDFIRSNQSPRNQARCRFPQPLVPSAAGGVAGPARGSRPESDSTPDWSGVSNGFFSWLKIIQHRGKRMFCPHKANGAKILFPPRFQFHFNLSGHDFFIFRYFPLFHSLIHHKVNGFSFRTTVFYATISPCGASSCLICSAKPVKSWGTDDGDESSAGNAPNARGKRFALFSVAPPRRGSCRGVVWVTAPLWNHMWANKNKCTFSTLQRKTSISQLQFQNSQISDSSMGTSLPFGHPHMAQHLFLGDTTRRENSISYYRKQRGSRQVGRFDSSSHFPAPPGGGGVYNWGLGVIGLGGIVNGFKGGSCFRCEDDKPTQRWF